MNHLVHFTSASSDRSKCGKFMDSRHLTADMREVTCGSCRRNYAGQFNARSRANRKARSMPGYSDPGYKGAGILCCIDCKRPYRDHPWPPMPCPGPDVDLRRIRT